jgi:guanosine-3',5'-bis(diphosphate) 3'-pyrophosphohydrolase
MYLDAIRSAIKVYYPLSDLSLVERAYAFAEDQHRGQVRASGEPYFNHLVETALLAAQLKLDLPSITAALLHDTIEDSAVEKSELANRFGSDVAEIVDGVTKLTRIEFESKEERQAESFRKMLLAMSRDIRVLLVKLCDRLHNMRTLHHLSEEKRRRIAQETLDIYAPLANRLGIYWLKSELEDASLLFLRPEIYHLLRENLGKTAEDRSVYIKEACKAIVSALDENGVSGQVSGRAKHLYSVWQKMERSNLAFDEVHDLLGFRVLVGTVRACYETLGIVHSKWPPVPDRFKDYIAMPKPNMYQSLHTTLIGPAGHRIEIQIRTHEMHRVAEEGIAAHWRYKEGGVPAGQNGPSGFDLRWVKDLVDSQQYLKNPDEFIQSVKGELFPEDVFVFTPKGDPIRLAARSTPVDFAYAVHTDIGHRTVGAKINGQIVPLDYHLQSGDSVEILTSKNHVPSKDWLRFVQSAKAKQRIRAFIKLEERSRSLAFGLETLTKDLRKVKLNLRKLEKDGKVGEVAHSLGLRSEGDLYAEIGYGKLPIGKVLAKFLPEGEGLVEEVVSEPSPLKRIFERAARESRSRVGVKVGGLDDVVVRFARCCEPLPGDRIIGFITRGRGVTVHDADCAQVHGMDPLRCVEVRWDGEVQSARKVRITVHSRDALGLLASLSQAITSHGANIMSAQCRTTSSGKAINTFELSIVDARQLDKVRRALEMLPGVTRVERISHVAQTVLVDD